MISTQGELPKISPPLLCWFLWYCRRYLRKHLNALRVSGVERLKDLGGRPLVLCMNHPSWWDPLIAAALADNFLSSREHYAPIDSKALERYGFFRKLGFFGVEQSSLRGAEMFLRISREVLKKRNSALWVTVQGRFADVRERPLQIAPGVAHLMAHAPDAVAIPVAMEIVQWQERTPEVLVRIGEPISSNVLVRKDWNEAIRKHLEQTMDELAAASIKRDERQFTTVLGGSAGVGGMYDSWRRMKSALRGKKFDVHHQGGRA